MRLTANRARLFASLLVLFGSFQPLWAREKPGSGDETLARGYDDSVVILLASKQEPDIDSPWRMKDATSERHLGVVVSGNRILTTAMTVGGATLVEMQRFGEARKYPLKLIFADYESNLALLEAEDSAANRGLTPLELGQDISLNSEAWIFSDRGTNQLIRNIGRLVEVGLFRATTSGYSLPTYQFKVQQTGLGWSEPIIRGQEFLGLTTGQDENHVFAVPASVIKHFLADQHGAGYRGFPDMGIEVHPLLSPYFRQLLKAEKFTGGEVVTQVFEVSPFFEKLKINDVILEVAGHPINETGLFRHPLWGRVHFKALVAASYSGDVLPLKIARDGQVISISATMKRHDSNQTRVPYYWFNQKVSPHLIFGGLLFQALDRDFLMEWGKEWRSVAPAELLFNWEYRNKPALKRERLIMVNRVLADEFNQGYDRIQNQIVVKVNGNEIHSFEDLSLALSRPVNRLGKRYAVVEFAGDGGEVILGYEGLEAAHARMAKTYSITGHESFFTMPSTH